MNSNSISPTLLEAALQPLSLDEFRDYVDQGRCMVLEGAEDKFAGLISAEDIERRLNDGCNANAFAQIIKEGSRAALLEHQTGWSPASIRKTEFAEALNQGYSFMMPNSSQITRGMAVLTTEIERFFGDVFEQRTCADVHLYVSTNADGNSYNAHRDQPQHKLLLQAVGDVDWQIFSPKQDIPASTQALTDEQQDQYLTLESEFTLTQGDMLYMPPGTFHRVVGMSGPRISISIPFYTMQGANPMDRSHIPFASLFHNAVSEAVSG